MTNVRIHHPDMKKVQTLRDLRFSERKIARTLDMPGDSLIQFLRAKMREVYIPKEEKAIVTGILLNEINKYKSAPQSIETVRILDGLEKIVKQNSL